MPNEPGNKTGRTLREQIRAASKATAEQTRAQKSGTHEKHGEHSKPDKKQKTTKRHATKSQIEKSKEIDKEDSKTRGALSLESIKDFFLEMNAPLRVLTLFVVIVVLAAAVLYPIGCTYYQAMRQEQRYQAELDAVNQRNDTIQSENEDLDTDEGVENQAREELGWVKDGERSTMVSNVDDGESSGMPSQVDSEKITAPSTWYYDILDVVFQYNGQDS